MVSKLKYGFIINEKQRGVQERLKATETQFPTSIAIIESHKLADIVA